MRAEPPSLSDLEYLQRRIFLTTLCRDSESLPRVKNAGKIIKSEDVEVQVMHNGLLVEKDGYCGPWMTEIISLLLGVHEPQEEMAFAEVIKQLKRTFENTSDRPTVVELGSYWAYYSMWFLKEFPLGRAICIEPDPDNLELGIRNFQLNEMSGEFSQNCISLVDGESVEFITEKTRESIMVPGITLQGIFNKYSLRSIDLLCVDIQGAEHSLISEGIKLLSNSLVRFLIVSTHEESISGSALTHQMVLDMIENSGGIIICEHTTYESCSGDGLIVATYFEQDGNLEIPISRVRAKDSLFGEPEIKIENLRKELELLQREVSRIKLIESSDEIYSQGRQDGSKERLLQELRTQIDLIESSEIWKMTRPIRLVITFIKMALPRIKSLRSQNQ